MFFEEGFSHHATQCRRMQVRMNGRHADQEGMTDGGCDGLPARYRRGGSPCPPANIGTGINDSGHPRGAPLRLIRSIYMVIIPAATRTMYNGITTRQVIRIMGRQFTAIIEKEEGGYVSLCPQLDIASQGDTVAQARMNLQEALELFFETASTEEITQRLHSEVYITQIEAAVG